MGVTLDAPHVWSPAGYGPMWKVRCDSAACYHRLYLFGNDADHAAKRAEVDHGWVRGGGGRVFCGTHQKEAN